MKDAGLPVGWFTDAGLTVAWVKDAGLKVGWMASVGLVDEDIVGLYSRSCNKIWQYLFKPVKKDCIRGCGHRVQ